MATDDNVVSDPKDDKAEGKSKVEKKEELNTDSESNSKSASSSDGQDKDKKVSESTEKVSPKMEHIFWDSLKYL